MCRLDVAENPTGTDRGELLIVADEPDTAASVNDVTHGCVEGEGVGHAGFIDHHQGGGADAGRPLRQLELVQ
jgi:hypothetical protein